MTGKEGEERFVQGGKSALMLECSTKEEEDINITPHHGSVGNSEKSLISFKF